jgi:hypothetical protein
MHALAASCEELRARTGNPPLGTGHKVTARVGRSDLGWAMENLWAVSMSRQFFCMSTAGPPNKNRYLLSSLIMINIIANKILKSNITQI